MEIETPVSRARSSVRYVVPLVAALLGCTPLIRYQWFSSHELCAPLERLYELHEVISANHRILAPWLPDLAFGHGYPLFIYYAPLATYVAETVHLLGADLLLATKASFALSLILSALTMTLYLSYLNRSFRLAAAPETIGIAAAVYVIAPYRMVDMYVRGSIAECWSFVFFPLILAALHMLADGRRRRGLLVGSISYAGLILSHNIMALYFSAVVCLYILLVTPIRRVWPWAAMMMVLGQALSAFFWLPALANKPLVNTDAATMWSTADEVASHAVHWPQFFSQQWGYGLSTPGPHDKMPFAIGWPIVGAVILIPLVVLDTHGQRDMRRFATVLLVMVALLVFAMTPAMRWDLVPELFLYIQFPWRLLALVTLFGSVAVFLALHVFVRWSDLHMASGRLLALFHISVVLMVLMLAAPTIRAAPIRIGQIDRDYILSRLRIEERKGFIGSTARAEYMPKTAAPETLQLEWNEIHGSESHVAIVDGSATIDAWARRGARYTVDVTCQTTVTLAFQSYYFPGWRYWRDGERRDGDITLGDNGFIHVELPPGSHHLAFEYGLPPWGRASQCVSLATVAGLIGWCVISNRHPILE